MAIELKNIYKNFGDKNVFTNLNLVLRERQFTAIMGPSGSGKTTLVNLLCGLLVQDYGEILGLGGHKISVVFQEDRLLEHRNGLANLLYVLRNPTAQEARAWELLAQAGLAGDAHKRSRDYSGGMKRRLSLCRALIADFSVLILDEPFKGLDANLKPKIMRMVKELCAEKTVILITHDISEVNFFNCPWVDITSHCSSPFRKSSGA